MGYGSDDIQQAQQKVLDACTIGLQIVVLEDAIGRMGCAGDNLQEISEAGAFQATASKLSMSSPFL